MVVLVILKNNMSIQFEIESIFKIESRNKYFVAAKLLSSNPDWKLTEKTRLGQIEIENWFDIPRALDKDGNIRFDLFIFQLKNSDDRNKIKINEIVELNP